jgi:hypothetical protein
MYEVNLYRVKRASYVGYTVVNSRPRALQAIINVLVVAFKFEAVDITKLCLNGRIVEL